MVYSVHHTNYIYYYRNYIWTHAGLVTTTRDPVNLELNFLAYLFLFLMASKMASPILAGDIVTFTPASLNASIFSVAPPLPPEMIAPAWPACTKIRSNGHIKPAEVLYYV